MPTFEPALQLNEGFYNDVVAPLLADVPHAAGRLGFGSEVLGFDTERSTDHAWGPQLHVLVAPDAIDDVRALVDTGLPETYRDWPTRYSLGAPSDRVMHYVFVMTTGQLFVDRLGFDATQGITTADWLTTPQQRLLEVTRGAVYHDDAGELTKTREALAYYPDDVWRWLIGCQWLRISQEEAFVGRTAEVADELGSAVVASRVGRDLMRLWFLFNRTYAPYSKWLGSAFARLPNSAPLGAALSDALAARDYPTREAALVRAYEIVAARHNELGITEPVDPAVREYWGRPFTVLHSERFAEACGVRMGVDGPFGAVDQWVDSTDVLSYPAHFRRLRALYELSGLS